MGVTIDITQQGEASADAVAVLVTQPPDGALDAPIAELARTGELRGERGEAIVLHTDGGRLVAAGVGKRSVVDEDALRTAGAAAAQALKRVGGSLAWRLDESLPVSLDRQAAAVVEGTVLGGYSPGRWKTNGDTAPLPIERILLARDDVRSAAERAALIAERTNRARDLANMPPNELIPQTLAEHAQALADEHEHLTAEALDPAQMHELGMGALLAVGQGSHNEPRLVVLRYEPPQAQRDVLLGLVGKSITFDTGGISIKPAGGMEAMKGDMAGGAGTLHGIGAVAALGLPVRAIAVLAAAENMPSGHAFRPGDILRAANGKTIEVINTDAEGRLVLADALWYARREGATQVLDLASLTVDLEISLGE
ncbi:MAG: leucyl aminopeptidase family protein, partial [Gaiellaceae bacterium]